MLAWVTGASGFVARHLIPALQADGLDVRGLGLEADVPPWLAPARYATLDLGETAAVEREARAQPPEAVVHLAGQSSAAASFGEPELTFRQNLGSALGLLEGLRRAGARPRLLLVSTSEVYGPQASAAPVAEDAPLNVVSPYGASKLAAETAGQAYARAYGLAVTVVRPFSHTGPGQDARFALSSFARQIALAERGAGPPRLLVGNLDVVRDYLDVRDVVDAYRLLLARAEAGTVYNIASGSGHRMRDLLGRLLALARVPLAVEADPARMRPQDLNFMVGAADRLRRLGWSPRHPVDEALAGLLEWWRARI
ncbi:MAG TPA: NAD-dependent epimerase/dehydratase family protein [Candidatus Saccharimonadales bacterium]|nr:NAD-dependent epimerase/dehydratase family protein [Candidatus Saccharimonadales bacterium]